MLQARLQEECCRIVSILVSQVMLCGRIGWSLTGSFFRLAVPWSTMLLSLLSMTFNVMSSSMVMMTMTSYRVLMSRTKIIIRFLDCDLLEC